MQDFEGSGSGEAELRQLHVCLDGFKVETRAAIADLGRRLDDHVRATKRQTMALAKERTVVSGRLRKLEETSSLANGMLLEIHQRLGAGQGRRVLKSISYKHITAVVALSAGTMWGILKALDKVWPSLPQLGHLAQSAFMILMQAAGK